MLARLVALFALAATFAAGAATAQTEEPPQAPSACVFAGLAEETPGVALHRVRYDGPLEAGEIAITYMGHSTFLIQTPGGLEIATDYGDWLPRDFAPDVATMNGAHQSHYSDAPPAAIAHVLRGWSPTTGPLRFDLEQRDARIRNVATDDIQGPDYVIEDGNSIFVFEIGDLCIAHLGHLHAEPSAEQYAAIGRIDIVFAPVEGGPYMLPPEQMLEVTDQLGARLVFPMHYFNQSSRERFARIFEARYEAVWSDDPTYLVSKATLPTEPQLILLPGLLQ